MTRAFPHALAAALCVLALAGGVRAEPAEKTAEIRALEGRLREYLQRTFPCGITQVSAGAEKIEIAGTIRGDAGDLWLAEVPMHADVTTPGSGIAVTPIRVVRETFSVAVDRFPKSGAREGDRLLSRWAIIRKTAAGTELLSHARYADRVEARHDLPEEKPRSRKGIGALWSNRPIEDLDALGIAAATVNIPLGSLMRMSPGPERVAFEHGGRTWFASRRTLAQLDTAMLEAAKRRIVVSAIILVPQPAKPSPDAEYARLVAHPDADPAGIYCMPDVTSAAGLAAYAAALDFLAERYSRPEKPFGRIHHWIVHNEVNAGWQWTNAGEKPEAVFTDLYARSMRAVHLLARQYDPHAKAFISLEHHWNSRMSPQCHKGRELLELLCDLSRAEGDFDWGLAHHPYPQDLFEPRVWRDAQATFDFDTPKITFKNLEVLDAWMAQPRARFQGKTRRVIHLTEQGLNSRDYREESLRDQAAGLAYAWHKVKRIPSIELFHYHNWADHRDEGGLRIGLRRFPDDPGDPHGKKPAWFVYQALDTPAEEDATAFAKPLIGIGDWAEILKVSALPK